MKGRVVFHSSDNALPRDTRPRKWVRETYIGRQFLASNTWFKWVLNVAFKDIDVLLDGCQFNADVILDAGCGQGVAFELIHKHFEPTQIIGVDIDSDLIDVAASNAKSTPIQVDLINGSMAELDLPANSVDIVFCHQLLHHTVEQDKILQNIKRVLKPGGLVLSGESCENFINIWWVRWFFRHPYSAQRSADGYIDLIANNGFEILNTQKTTPWWSRLDLGLLEKVGLLKAKKLEPTELLVVARKPV